MGFNAKLTVVKPLDIKKLKKNMGGMTRVKIGLPKGSLPYPDGTSVIDVGLWNEFGTVNIPERSFLRTGISKNRDKYKKINRLNLKAVLKGSLTTEKALNRLGAIAAGDVKENITGIRKPANAKSTVQVKKSANPLIDTGHMRAQITYEVDKK